MPSVTFAEVADHHPDVLLPPDDEFVEAYHSRLDAGIEAAASKRVAFVAICRNAMPWLQFTIQHVIRTASRFADWRAFILENDSTDGTKEELARWDEATGGRLRCEMSDNGRPHLNYTKSSDRTIALAEYRNRCRDWVAENCREYDYTIVFDTDPWGGWSVDGVMNTLGHLEDHEAYGDAAGMGSYSFCFWGPPVWPQVMPCHYDGWACRWTWVGEHHRWPYNPAWFHFWHPPVGSPPVRMTSCFGQLAVYRTANYLRGTYRGEDCEHVAHWRSAGGDCYLNPSQRVVSFWVPRNGQEEPPGGDGDAVHRDIQPDVVGRDADQGHRRDAQDLG